MKIAFVSDVHSNIEALKTVLRFLEKKKVDRIYVAGDLLGYYYDAAEVINLCMSREDIFCIRGNHDRNFLDAMNNVHLMNKFTNKYGSSYKKAKDELGAHQVNWIRALPKKLNIELSGLRITVAHGSVDDEDTYIYPDAPAEVFQRQVLHSDITVLGHTHHTFIWCEDSKYLINPGSVGQPRDQGSLACAVVLDTSNKSIIPYKVKFNIENLKKEILKFDPKNEYLLSVLERY